jgi:hypothetical protein
MKIKLQLRRETIRNLADLKTVRGGQFTPSVDIDVTCDGPTCGAPTDCIPLCDASRIVPCEGQTLLACTVLRC